VTAALIGAAATLIAALAGFAASYYLKWRDERRQGGAAERLLRAELTRAREVLATDKPSPPLADAEVRARVETAIDALQLKAPAKALTTLQDLQQELDDGVAGDAPSAVPIWHAQWERFGARFTPPVWNRFNAVVDTLDRFWELVDEDPEVRTAAFAENENKAGAALPSDQVHAKLVWNQAPDAPPGS
jgi:hypothetical protein